MDIFLLEIPKKWISSQKFEFDPSYETGLINYCFEGIEFKFLLFWGLQRVPACFEVIIMEYLMSRRFYSSWTMMTIID